LVIISFHIEYKTIMNNLQGDFASNLLSLLPKSSYNLAMKPTENEIIHFLKTRRSVRAFRDDPVSDQTIKGIVEIAMLAPSAMNQQILECYIIRNTSTLRALTAVHQGAKPFEQAQVGIIPVMRILNAKAPRFIQQDGAAFTMNVLYGAHALGLGSVWCGIHPLEEREQKVREIVQIPQDLIPFSCIALGYPEQEPQEVDRFSEEKIHWD